MILSDLQIREPPKNTYVSLTAALTWIEFQHSLELEEMLKWFDEDEDEDGKQQQGLRLRLQHAWRRLADDASAGEIEIRGRVVGDRVERTLDREELRNSRFLAWVGQPDSTFDVRVERHDGTDDLYDGEWDRLGDNRGYDFHHVVVRRHELVRLNPVAAPSTRLLRRPITQIRSASEWLRAQFQALPPRSVSKKQMISRLQAGFGLSEYRATQIWSEVSRDYPAWSVPGRPRKIIG